MSPPSTVFFGGGVHGKVCWLMAYKIVGLRAVPISLCIASNNIQVVKTPSSIRSMFIATEPNYIKINIYFKAFILPIHQ